MEKVRKTAIFQNFAKHYQRKTSISGLRTGVVRHQVELDTSFEGVALDFWQSSKFDRTNCDTWASIAAYYGEVNLELQFLAHEKQAQGDIDLPNPLPLKVGLDRVIMERRSTRQFSGDAIALQYLSTLLRYSNGITCEMHTDSGNRLNLRASPSGGGLYPVDVYIQARSVEKLPQSIYRYFPKNHSLKKIRCRDVKTKVDDTIIEQEATDIDSVATIIIFSISPWRTMRKYGARGLRFAIHEVGSISQNLHLVVRALGLRSTDWASFEEEKVNKLLNFDGIYRSVAHMILVGRPLID